MNKDIHSQAGSRAAQTHLKLQIQFHVGNARWLHFRGTVFVVAPATDHVASPPLRVIELSLAAQASQQGRCCTELQIDGILVCVGSLAVAGRDPPPILTYRPLNEGEREQDRGSGEEAHPEPERMRQEKGFGREEGEGVQLEGQAKGENGDRNKGRGGGGDTYNRQRGSATGKGTGDGQ